MESSSVDCNAGNDARSESSAAAPARSAPTAAATPRARPGSWLNKLGAQATSVAAEKAAAKSDKAVESAKLAAQTLFESEAEREFARSPCPPAPSATATT